jgi:protein TonB
MVLTTFPFRRITFTLSGICLFVFTACSDDASQQKQSTPTKKTVSTPTAPSDNKPTKVDQPSETAPKQLEKTILFAPPISDQSVEPEYYVLQNESVLEIRSSDMQSGSDDWGSSVAPPPPQYKTEEQVLTIVDPQASFPGGNAAMLEYLRKNMQYPQDAIEKEITGKCYVQFVVKSDGSIGNVKLIRSVYPSIDNEAIRLIKGMPTWIPAQMDGKNVNSYYTLPIKFALD